MVHKNKSTNILLKGSNKWKNKKESFIDSFFKDYIKVESSKKVFLSNLTLDKTIYVNSECDVFIVMNRDLCCIFKNVQFLKILKSLLLRDIGMSCKSYVSIIDYVCNNISKGSFVVDDVIELYNEVMSILGRNYLFNVKFVIVESNSDFMNMIYRHNEMQYMYYTLQRDEVKSDLFNNMLDNEYVLITFINKESNFSVPYVKFFFNIDEPTISILNMINMKSLSDFNDKLKLEYNNYFIDFDSAIELLKKCGDGVFINFDESMLNGVCVNPKTGLIEDSEEDKLVLSYLGM